MVARPKWRHTCKPPKNQGLSLYINHFARVHTQQYAREADQYALRAREADKSGGERRRLLRKYEHDRRDFGAGRLIGVAG